jgi:hypothetical protein
MAKPALPNVATAHCIIFLLNLLIKKLLKLEYIARIMATMHLCNSGQNRSRTGGQN